MNLIQPSGPLERYSLQQVSKLFGFTPRQIRNLVEKGKLTQAYSGSHGFLLKHLNEFIVRWNAGKIELGRGRKSA